MKILRLNRQSERFYELLGPVFGSRIIERETHDRFYDDPDKEWFVAPGRGAASVRDDEIRNFWAAGAKDAEELVAALTEAYDSLRGIVPRTYESAFRHGGFTTRAHRVNFIEVRYEKD